MLGRRLHLEDRPLNAAERESCTDSACGVRDGSRCLGCGLAVARRRSARGGRRALVALPAAMHERIPPGFNVISYAIETAPTLTGEELRELEASPWASVPDRGEEVAELWRQEAGAALLTIAEESGTDPERAALLSQLRTAQAAL